MTPDLYTKIVLGTIAVTLIYYVLRTEQAVTPLFGSNPPQAAVQSEQPPKPLPVLPVNLAQIDGVPIASRITRPRDEAVPVRIVNLPP